MSPTSPTYKILTTPPPRRSFPLLPSPTFFTGDLFDRLVLFLHKYHIAFTSIECVARGVDKASALADGVTLCVYVVQGEYDDEGDEGVVLVKKEGGKGVVAVKEVKEEEEEEDEKEKGEKDVSGQEKEWPNPDTDPQHGKEQLKLRKPQTSEEQTNAYIEEVARLFYKSEFAKEIPREIRFVEFVGVIPPDDPGRTSTCNESVLGFLTGS